MVGLVISVPSKMHAENPPRSSSGTSTNFLPKLFGGTSDTCLATTSTTPQSECSSGLWSALTGIGKMKFIYVDESGGSDQSDVFVMSGLMVDAYRLRKKTEEFDGLLQSIVQLHAGTISDFKTKRFINGKRGWSQIDPFQRKKFLRSVCKLAVDGGKIFGIAMSFSGFNAAIHARHGYPYSRKHYWLASSMFIACLIQKKMQKLQHNKGHTVVVMDDHRGNMPKLSDALYKRHPWFDGLYRSRRKLRGQYRWDKRTELNRFDQIINTPFAIKSDHSSLIQVADVICYIYRRHLELTSHTEEWDGEREYFRDTVSILERRRETIGQCPDEPCVRFYQSARHSDWKL